MIRVTMTTDEVREAIREWLENHEVPFSDEPAIEFKMAGSGGFALAVEARVTVQAEAPHLTGPYR